MKQSELVAPVIEPVTGRYDRDLLNINDDRKVRGFDYEDGERRSRRYVDPDTVAVTVTDTRVDGNGDANPNGAFVDTEVTVTGTVSARGDNRPAGFDVAAFEAGLVYDPNA